MAGDEATPRMFRLGYLPDGREDVEHSFPPIFTEEVTGSGTRRLVATAPGGDPSALEALALTMPGPFMILYVLHTPREGSKPGRYQSDEMTATELSSLIASYSDYFIADGRFDLWVHSPEGRSTVIWDRHNLIFAYGDMPTFSSALRAMGYETGVPELPSPHVHYYRSEMDERARSLLQGMNWRHSPLEPEDEQ